MGIGPVAMLIAGAVALIAGFGIIVFRRRLAATNRANIEAKLGKLLPGFAEGSTPGKIVPVGIGAIIIGLVLIGNARFS